MPKTNNPLKEKPQEITAHEQMTTKLLIQDETLQTKKFNWRSLILPVSIFLTLVIAASIALQVKENKPASLSSISPKIQKISSQNISFVKNEDASYNFKAENQIFQAQFGIENQSPAISFGVDQERAIIFSYQNGKNNTPAIEIGDETLLFKEVEKNIDIRYQTLPNGIKEEIILNRPRQKTEGANIFVFESSFQGAYAQKTTDGTLNPIFYDSKGNYLFHFDKPFAIDQSGNRTNDVTLQIENKNNDSDVPTYSIILTVDQEWLDSPDRSYPIIIDPSVIREVATGGTVTYVGGDTIHTFTSSDTLVVNSAITAQVLVVAGGGNGGPGANDCLGGGGGGAGGLIYNTSFAIGVGSFGVTVGSAGTNSVFSTLTAVAGGSGGVTGGNGGSGGGSMGSNQSAGTGTSGQGNNGGIGYGTYGLTCTAGGGGGGAGAVGGAGTGYTAPGGGGTGTNNNISGSAVTYATGGSGGVSTGGIAGGAGAVNTGNGGGGGSGGSLGVSDPYGYGAGGAGGNGGSGIIIIRYTTEYFDTDAIMLPSNCHVKENLDDSQLEVIWTDEATGEDYYEVQRNADEAGWVVLATSLAANTTSFVDSTVASDHTYQYRVTPYVGTTYGDWCTTAQLNLGVGDLNFGGLNMDGLNFN